MAGCGNNDFFCDKFLFLKKQYCHIISFYWSSYFGFFVANLDHFLIIWDEQYHALVAKNLMKNPFKPVLYETPLLAYNSQNWTENYIWLHKQPLFLWQIAISLKLFGVNEMSVRIPSIIMHAFTTIFIYRIGKISYNNSVGFLGALFFSMAYYPLELLAGRYSTDHNDVAFLFYVTVSFWAWFEYNRSKKTYWLFLIGLFSGCAVLVKWIMGFLIYVIWFFTTILDKDKFLFKLKSYKPLAKSLIVSFVVVIPWQIFIFIKYPNEAFYEFGLNSSHFSSVVENHGGNFWFHFNALKNIYGSGFLVPFFLLFGLIILIRNTTEKTYRIVISSAIVFVYAFFTIAKTKMISFTLIVSPFIFLGLASLVDFLMILVKKYLKKDKISVFIKIVFVLITCWFLLNMPGIERNHSFKYPGDNCGRGKEELLMKYIRETKKLDNEKYVVFNTGIRLNGRISVMFYTNSIAYDFIPDKEQIDKIRCREYKIAVFDTGNLPDYILNDDRIVKIKP
ncbi:MAG: glycosyltransferase family 39 protein [Bacteroidales bacterium]|nr:glycosyltransferase family 39 protein [Bacteroidales bacterium]